MTPERLIADVTQEDIDNGQPHSMSTCPVALSLRRRYDFDTVWASWDSTLVKPYREPAQTYKGSRRSRNFMQFFDAGYPVQPSRFIFEKRG